jgi:hypothetical protein
MSTQTKPAPSASSSSLGATAPRRTGASTPTKRGTVGAAASPALSGAPSPSHAAAAFAATQPLFAADGERKEQASSAAFSFGASASPSPSPVRMQSKLEHLANRFDGFEDELHLSRNKKKAEEDKRIQILQTQLTNLQTSLALESKNRSQSIKALQNWLTDRIAAWTEQIEAPMQARLSALAEQITFLVGRIDGLEAKQKVDRETFPKLVDARCAELLNDISTLRARFAENVSAREEKEKRILLKVQSESNKVAVQFASDKAMSDEKIAVLRRSIDDEVALRVRAHELVTKQLNEELAAVKADIEKEKGERESADEVLVQSINHYAAALQDGIRVVSAQ